MGVPLTPFRALLVGWLAMAWHHWIGGIPFPFAGGEAHWVMNHVRPLGFADGLFLGGLNAVAGVSLAVVLRLKRLWLALLVGVVVPGFVAGTNGQLDGSVSEVIQALGFYGFPLVVVGLVVVLSRVKLGSVGIGVVAWWPGFLHLLWYLGATGLPEAFRDGVGVMWVAGGLLVGAVARDGSPLGDRQVVDEAREV